jgi:hypothetical protein
MRQVDQLNNQQLSSQELKDKISFVDADIIKLQSEGGSDRKISALTEYKDYLKDELKNLENVNRSGTSSK